MVMLLRGNALHDKDLLVNVDKNRACEYMGQSRLDVGRPTAPHDAQADVDVDRSAAASDIGVDAADEQK